MTKHIDIILTTALLFIFPVDLLYLYFAGGWHEPNSVILYTELGLLFLLPVFAVWRFCRYLSKERRRRYVSNASGT